MTRPDALTCSTFTERITDYMENALSFHLRARVEEHLAGCAHCRTYLAQMEQMVRLLGQLPKGATAAADREALIALFRAWREQHQ